MFVKFLFALMCIGETITALPPSTPEVTRIYFVRNGESEFSATNGDGIKHTSGKSPEVPLTERGIEQAKQFGEWLSSEIQDAVIYTPPAARAEETAALMQNDRIVLGGTLEGLFEVGMGEWEGKIKDLTYQDAYQKWKDLPASEKFVTPKVASGESYFDASERAFRDLQTIIDLDSGKTIFVVTGENLMNALILRWTHPELSTEPGSPLPIYPIGECDFFMIEIPQGQSIESGQNLDIKFKKEG